MIPSFAIGALFLATAVSSVPLNSTTPVARTRYCGSEISTDTLKIAEAKFQTSRVARPNSLKAPNATINVHFHVIHSDNTIEGGFVPDDQVEEQIAVMNQDFSGTGLTFNLVNVTRIENAEWFSTVGPENAAQTEMKEALRVGDAATLNVYTVGFETGEGEGLLGYATFPFSFEEAPADDGVVILYSSLPGGSTPNFNLGKTLVHEVGHWVGLFHTFQGGCSSEGDQVSDTPAEASPASGCPVRRNTCPGAGLDPISNFMDYSDDSCMDTFSPGQITRLGAQMRTFRSVDI